MEDILAMTDLDLKSVLEQIDDPEYLSNIERYFRHAMGEELGELEGLEEIEEAENQEDDKKQEDDKNQEDDKKQEILENNPSDVLLELFSFTDFLLMPKFKEFFAVPIPSSFQEFKQHVLYNNPLTTKFKEINQIKKELIKNPYEESAGLFKCLNPKCGSMNTFNTKKQTRSADEPMTVFIQCFTCSEVHRL